MRAALITGAGQVEIRDVPDPVPAENGVVVDVAFCGICGTDVHAFTSGRDYPPAVCGHEWTGRVSAVGPVASGFGEGDRVVVAVPPPCGSCDACRAGAAAHCSTVFAVARGRDEHAPAHGGFAPRIGVGTDRIIAAHPDLDDETLAQVEPVTVSLHAVHRSGLRDGDSAVVLGAGPVGLTTMQCATASGAGSVIVVEPDESRRALALALGADAVATPEAAVDVVRDRTGGLRAGVVFDCVGGADTLQAGVDLARRGGSVCLVGFGDEAVTIHPGTWLRQEITVTTALAYVHDDFAEAMELLADRRVRVDLLHTATTQLDGLADTLADFASGTSTQMKVLVNPTWA